MFDGISVSIFIFHLRDGVSTLYHFVFPLSSSKPTKSSISLNSADVVFLPPVVAALPLPPVVFAVPLPVPVTELLPICLPTPPVLTLP